MPTLTENIDRINELADELNVHVRFDGDAMCLFIKNTTTGRQRIKRVINLDMENVERAMYWVAGRSTNQ
jgi:hypothetical protein